MAIILFGLWLNQRGEPLAAKRPGGDDGEAEDTGSLLCQFVHHDGAIVGETVAVDGDQLILKQAGVFKAVPRAQVAPEGDDLRLAGTIDWAAAEAAGAAWHDAHRKGADAEVAGELTRSEDVVAPALEALKEREGVDATGGAGAKVAAASGDEEE